MRHDPSARRPAAAHPRVVSAAVEALEDRKLMSTVVALSGADTLLFLDSAAPTRNLASVRVRGLQRREQLLGIDFRPANNQLYGAGSTGRLYQIDLTSGTATAVGNTSFDPALTGTALGIDFNPQVDRLRVVSDVEENYRVNPDTGAVVDADPATAAVQVDTPLAYLVGDPGATQNPNVIGAAYTNNVVGSTGTTLYGIDVDTNALVRIGSENGTPDSPNTGRITTVGPLTVDPVGPIGFDIETTGTAAGGAGGTNTAYAALATSARGRSSLYTINLGTGAATSLGEIRGARRAVRDIAVVPAADQVIAVDGRNRLFTFNSALPTVATQVRITGLARGERVLGVDVRPSNNTLYAYTNQNRLYTVNPTTGVAGAVGLATPGVGINRRGLAGVDFNPVADRLRVVASTGENIRLDPNTGGVVDANPATPDVDLDVNLAYAPGDVNANARPAVSGAAYSNTFANPAATETSLFAIDSNTDALVTIGQISAGPGSPNAGQLFTVGSLGADVRDTTGFDIVSGTTGTGSTLAATNTGYATFRERSGGFGLYRIDLTNGAATRLSTLARGLSPIGIAVLGTPVGAPAAPTVPTVGGTGGTGPGGTNGGTGGDGTGGDNANPPVIPVPGSTTGGGTSTNPIIPGT